MKKQTAPFGHEFWKYQNVLWKNSQRNCNKIEIDILEAAEKDKRAMGLVESLKQTIKNIYAYIKEEKIVKHKARDYNKAIGQLGM